MNNNETDNSTLADRLLAIGRDCATRLKEPSRSSEHGAMLYDQRGLPRDLGEQPAMASAQAMPSATSELQIRGLGAAFGAEVRGLTWGVPAPAVVHQLTIAMRRH